jgi:hypothetical protein
MVAVVWRGEGAILTQVLGERQEGGMLPDPLREASRIISPIATGLVVEKYQSCDK